MYSDPTPKSFQKTAASARIVSCRIKQSNTTYTTYTLQKTHPNNPHKPHYKKRFAYPTQPTPKRVTKNALTTRAYKKRIAKWLDKNKILEDNHVRVRACAFEHSINS